MTSPALPRNSRVVPHPKDAEVQPAMVNTRGSERRSSWGERIAIITAIASVIGTVVTVLAFLYSEDVWCRLNPESSSCYPTPGPVPLPDPWDTEPTTTTQYPPEPEPTTTRRPLPPPPPDAVRWQGQFLIRQVTGVELDTLPPSPATGPGGNIEAGDLFYDNSEALGYRLTTFGAPVAVWQSDQELTPRACADAITTVGVGQVTPEPGMVLCVATTGRRVAAVQVVEEGSNGVLLNVMVWG